MIYMFMNRPAFAKSPLGAILYHIKVEKENLPENI